MPDSDNAVLRPTLRRAKETLRSALEEACHTDLERANTGELIRIEEVLAIANEAAKEAVSVRRRLSAEHATAPSASPSSSASPASSAREIVDDRGARWAVFAVVPAISENRPTVRERFRAGWLSFDSGEETRRLVPIPDGWQQLTDLELRILWAQAEASPRRAHPAPHSASERPD